MPSCRRWRSTAPAWRSAASAPGGAGWRTSDWWRRVPSCSRWAVEAGWNLLLSGGTGAGKTTLLNALAGEASPEERIVTIEETAELALGQPHVVRLEARPANAEGAGAVPVRALVRAALRLRPDRLIVGEVRGEEAFDLLQALNTGHCGSLCTIHANGPAEALARLESLALLAGTGLPLGAIRAQIRSSVDAVIHVARRPDGRRAIEAIAELAAPPACVRSIPRRPRTGPRPHPPAPPCPDSGMTPWSGQRRRQAEMAGALPDLLERVAGDLRTGAAPHLALAEAAGRRQTCRRRWRVI